MDEKFLKQPLLISAGLSVNVVKGEIVLDGAGSGSPSLTAFAARETARRLIEAADKLQPL
ncbi:MAG: hypothetical protein ACRYG4_03100 [Janthinobacterium lividum]